MPHFMNDCVARVRSLPLPYCNCLCGALLHFQVESAFIKDRRLNLETREETAINRKISKNDILTINPALIVWPTDSIRFFLVGDSSSPSGVFFLPAEAVSLLRQFSIPSCGCDILPTATVDDLEILSKATEAGLLVTNGALDEAAYEALFDGFRAMDWKLPLLEARDIEAKTVQRISIGKRSVVIIDNLLSPNRVNALARWLKGLPYRLADYDTEETSDVRHWICEFPAPALFVNCASPI